MREILFKAKRSDNGEWVEGYHVFCRKRHYILTIINEIIGYDEREDEWSEINPDTLCQYTGLTDKNGQKIWENDILCGHLDDKYLDDITYKKVIWCDNGFYTTEDQADHSEPLDGFDKEYFEVCGNIFDNTELVGGAE